MSNATQSTIYTKQYLSPIGELILGSYEDKLCLCDWQNEKRRTLIDKRLQKAFNATYSKQTTDIIEQSIEQLEEFFAHERTKFNIPLAFAGTDFQKLVWNKLLEIPYGETISYGEMAKQLDIPQSVRAVANANGANAISIFVPCHRVIGSNHQLTGYAGGIDAKRALLNLELPLPKFII